MARLSRSQQAPGKGTRRSSGRSGWSQGGFDRQDQGGEDNDGHQASAKSVRHSGFGQHGQNTKRDGKRAGRDSSKGKQEPYTENGYGPGAQSYGQPASGQGGGQSGGSGKG